VPDPDPDPGREAATGALLAALVGDCLGAPYEGRGPVDRATGRARAERALARGRLRYTDDTQLLLALGGHLLVEPTVDPPALARAILDRYEDHRGYGAGMRRLVRLWRRGRDVEAAATAVFPDGSLGNGAAMRVAVVGVRWAGDAARLDEAATRSARVTHVHPVGVDGAVVQARAVGRAMVAGRFTPDDIAALDPATAELRAGVEAAALLPADTPPAAAAEALGTAVVAHRSVPAALWCAATGGDVAGTVTRALALGGDTDTIGAMAGAIRGAADRRPGVPAAWATVCEGHDGVLRLAAALHDAAGGGG
jgi:poly(ADP-ribose) glycohydrolase ARH3